MLYFAESAARGIRGEQPLAYVLAPASNVLLEANASSDIKAGALRGAAAQRHGRLTAA